VEKIHPVLGAELIKNIKMMRRIVPLVRHHHEHWDGSGHPDRLAGEQIPLGARIICLIENLEELRFAGIKDPELTAMQIQMAKNGSGNRFDPKVVETYLSLTEVPSKTRVS
jgi:response regulator RpfG family c-di-GMP phosphodiesterase